MGGSRAPDMPTPAEEANAQMMLQRQQQEYDTQKAEAAKTKEQKELEAKIARNKAMAQKLYDRASGSIGRELTTRGFTLGSKGRDPYGIAQYYLGELNDVRAGFDPREDDPSGMYDRVSIDDIIGMFEDRERNEFKSRAESKFGGDYGYDTFNYKDDDSIIMDYLNQQGEDTKAGLERSKARGQLNQNAFARALKEMDNQRAVGRSNLETMGRGVIDRNRTGLNTAVDNVFKNISGWRFGSGLNMGDERNRVDSIANDYRTGFKGDILSSFGDYQAFDLDKLVGKARNVTGYTGGTSATGNNTGLVGAFDDQLRSNQTQGVF